MVWVVLVLLLQVIGLLQLYAAEPCACCIAAKAAQGTRAAQRMACSSSTVE